MCADFVSPFTSSPTRPAYCATDVVKRRQSKKKFVLHSEYPCWQLDFAKGCVCIPAEKLGCLKLLLEEESRKHLTKDAHYLDLLLLVHEDPCTVLEATAWPLGKT